MDYVATGDAEQASLVYNSLRNIETEHRSLLLGQAAQRKRDDEAAFLDASNKEVTFAERRKQLEDQHAAVLKEAKHVLPAVQELVKRNTPAPPPAEAE